MKEDEGQKMYSYQSSSFDQAKQGLRWAIEYLAQFSWKNWAAKVEEAPGGSAVFFDPGLSLKTVYAVSFP